MNKIIGLMLALSLLLTGGLVTASPVADEDGFKNPLVLITLDDHDYLEIFEQSSLALLDVNDPFEFWNRRVYHFNQRFDEHIFRPIIRVYRATLPRPARKSVSHFFGNLADINSLVNSMLQLKFHRSASLTARIMFNTSLGLGGLFDPATRMGLPKHVEDFGQTLSFYGVPTGAYFMLPILGPSNMVDATGRVFDFATLKAINFLEYGDATSRFPPLLGLQIVNERYISPFEYGQMNSPFEYEQLRYLYSLARRLQSQD